jgi:hypothetical protein
MPTIKCPTCKRKGETGLPWGRPGSVGPDILVKPGNINGSTKSLLYCRRCGTAFLKGPVGRGQPAPAGMWPAFVDFAKRETQSSGAGLVFYEKF